VKTIRQVPIAAAAGPSGASPALGRLSRMGLFAATTMPPEFPGDWELGPPPSPWRHPLRAGGWLLACGAGFAALVMFVAVLAAVPGLNLLALGWLLEAEGRVVRSGKLRDGLPWLGVLPRLGAIAVGVGFWLLVVRLVGAAADDAQLVDPGSAVAVAWSRARWIVAVGVAVHLLLALAAGARLGRFFRPLGNLLRAAAAVRRGRLWQDGAAAVGRVLDVLAPLSTWRLGLGGLCGGLLWLVPPTLLFAAARFSDRPAAPLVSVLGGVLLAVVLMWVPFLQARYAASGRLRSFVEVGAVREAFRRAPVAMLLALVVLHGLTIPLHLLEVVVPPRDAVWLFTPLFVLLILPGRLAVGWAAARAAARPRRAWLPVRLLAGTACWLALAVHVTILFLAPVLDAVGTRVLFQHPAVLLPTPFP